MATAPTVPDFTQYNFAPGDTTAAITKQNGQNAALVQYGEGLKIFGEGITADRDAAVAAKGGAEDARDLALQYRDEAQQIVSGDIIDDAAVSASMVWSSQKISGELGDIGTILDSINGEAA